jgi:hypothetical protein
VFGEGVFGARGNVWCALCSGYFSRKENVGKEILREVDRGHHNIISRCTEKAPLIVMVEEVVGWRRLWGHLLDYNNKRTEGLKVLSRLLGHHGKGKKPCPFCDWESMDNTVDCILNKLKNLDTNFLTKFDKFSYPHVLQDGLFEYFNEEALQRGSSTALSLVS